MQEFHCMPSGPPPPYISINTDELVFHIDTLGDRALELARSITNHVPTVTVNTEGLSTATAGIVQATFSRFRQLAGKWRTTDADAHGTPLHGTHFDHGTRRCLQTPTIMCFHAVPLSMCLPCGAHSTTRN